MTPRLSEAINLIAQVPGYAAIAQALTQCTIRYVPTLEDRGQATLTGVILLGPEAWAAGPVGLAETLVHEHYHTRQNPFAKTPSFWIGVFTRTPVMARYERPAYQAAFAFLEQLAIALPEYADQARAEAAAVRLSYETLYRLPL